MNSEEKNYLLVVDILRVTDAKKICAQEAKEWEPLYLGTDWQPQISNSPIWIKVNPLDELWQRWENDLNWATSAIIFVYQNDKNIEDVVKSLQKNITARSEDGRLFLYRFYSPYTLSVVAKYGDEDVINATLGLTESACFSPSLSDEYVSSIVRNTHRDLGQKQLSLPSALIEELLQ